MKCRWPFELNIYQVQKTFLKVTLNNILNLLIAMDQSFAELEVVSFPLKDVMNFYVMVLFNLNVSKI
jgi:hypothetical protein